MFHTNLNSLQFLKMEVVNDVQIYKMALQKTVLNKTA